MHSRFGSFGMLTKEKFWEQHFVPELLGRSEIGFPPAGANTNEKIGKHVHTRGFSFILVFIFVTTDQ